VSTRSPMVRLILVLVVILVVAGLVATTFPPPTGQ
jgi:hypothetical protein